MFFFLTHTPPLQAAFFIPLSGLEVGKRFPVDLLKGVDPSALFQAVVGSFDKMGCSTFNFKVKPLNFASFEAKFVC